MAARASWKGYLKVGELVCHVGLYAAASTNDRITFHTINRETGNRVKRIYIDRDTGKPVPNEEQVKGYEVGKDQYVILDPEEVASVIPVSDKTLTVDGFVPNDEVDTLYLDRPYYLAPADEVANKAFTLVRDGLRKSKTAALAQAVLFRRLRTLLIRPFEDGLVADTLNFDYQVRSAEQAFDGVPDMTIKGEMLDLAKHIIGTKSGKFDISKFDDRYESAVAELVKAKLEGKEIKRVARKEPSKVIDLMEALRQSAGTKAEAAKKTAAKAKPRKRAAAADARTPRRTAAPRRKAG